MNKEKEAFCILIHGHFQDILSEKGKVYNGKNDVSFFV